MKRRQSVSLMAGLSLALLAGHATPARANFTWMSPSPAAAPPAAPSPQMPAPAANMSNVPQMPAQKVAPIQAAPLAVVAADKVPPVEDVSGFASDVPLSLALQQVVPPEYKVVLAQGVKAHTHVSWKGGKPWTDVLSGMLSSVDLAYALHGRSLTVERPAGQARTARQADMIPEDMVAAKQTAAAAPVAAPIPVAPSVKKSSAEVMAPPVSTPSAMTAPAPVPVSLPAMAAPEMSEAPVVPPPEPLTAKAQIPQQAASKMSSPEIQTATSRQTSAALAQQSTVMHSPVWRAQSGTTLKTVLEAWAKAAHVHLYWAIDYNYRVDSDVAYKGSFEQAAAKLFDMFASVHPQPYGQLHMNAAGQNVLIVRTYRSYN